MDPGQAAEAAGVEETAGVDGDQEDVAQIVDDLEAEVVVGAAVEKLGDAAVAAREVEAVHDERRERTREGSPTRGIGRRYLACRSRHACSWEVRRRVDR